MNNLNFEYVPLTFVNDNEEIRKQIRNTLIFIYLFEKYNKPVRLRSLIEGTQYGYNASALQSGKNKFLRISDIHDSKVDWGTVPFCNCNDETTYLLQNDDILIARTGGTTGKSFKIENPPLHAIYAGYLIRIRAKENVNPDYIYLFLHSFAYWSQIINLNERNFRPKANAENLKDLILPDCPKHIQDEIVRISRGENLKGYENLFSKIDYTLERYDKIQEIKQLDKEQLSHLQNLNQAILQEAFTGKLAMQDPMDESASDLLRGIKGEKTSSKSKESPSRFKSELNKSTIPKSWVWCTLGEIVDHNAGKTLDGGRNKGELKDYITTSNLYWGRFELSKLKKMPFQKSEIERCTAIKGDLLICEGGEAGRSAVWENSYSICFQNHIHRVRPYSGINSYYIYYFMIKLFQSGEIHSYRKGMGIHNLSGKALSSIVIPLPPINEQKRIVAEIERKFALTYQLKEQIIINQEKTENLIKALLHKAFEVNNQVEKLNEFLDISDVSQPSLNSSELTGDLLYIPIPYLGNSIQDINWELAMMVAHIESKLGIGYGDVGLQKNVFNASVKQTIFSKNYHFINSNFGTYSYELKDDLIKNPYLIKKNINGKEVYAISAKHRKDLLGKLTAPENRQFIQAFDNILSIYEHPFINKETDRIELFNTVLKISLDKSSREIDVIYQGLEEWCIKQKNYRTKAEKFSKLETSQMLKLLISKEFV